MLSVFDAALTSSFAASTPIMLSAERLTLDFIADVSVAATIEWFLEFASDDPNAGSTIWRREVAEEDVGGGVVNMPIVVRSFQANGGGTLAAGQHAITTQFVRSHQFARLSVRASAGTVSRLRVLAPFGAAASSP